MVKKQTIKEGDQCLDLDCSGKLVIALICDDDTCGGTIHPADGYKIQIPRQLSKIQADLLLGFLMDHKKDIERSPYKVALKRIIDVLKE